MIEVQDIGHLRMIGQIGERDGQEAEPGVEKLPATFRVISPEEGIFRIGIEIRRSSDAHGIQTGWIIHDKPGRATVVKMANCCRAMAEARYGLSEPSAGSAAWWLAIACNCVVAAATLAASAPVDVKEMQG